ncbi:MAG: hemolysin family protein [Roseiflexaceae bacterium]
MSGNLLIEAVIILVLIVVNGFFAASEIAIVSARKGRLEQQADEGHRGAAVALELAQNPNRFLSTVQVGITIISTLAAAFGGANFAQALEVPLAQIPALAPYASTLALALVVVIISYLSLIIGELVPKRLALQGAEATAGTVAPVMRWMARVAGPVVTFLTFSTELVLRLLGRHKVAEQSVTEDDVKALVREGTAEGSLEQAEEELINSVFTFTERTVRSLMTPRTQVVALDIETPFDQAIQLVTESGYSRIPVYQDSLDQVIGILYVKDLLRAWGRSSSTDVRQLLRPPLHVLESQRAVAAFQILKQQRSALAIVLDEYGQVSGLISIEDMLEELVGDIDDEYDEKEEAIVKREDGSYLVDGLLPFQDLCERLDLPDAEEVQREHDFETVAGFFLALLGRMPTVGDTVTWQGYRLEVVDMDARRIDKILLRPPVVENDQTQNILASGAARTVTPEQ